MEFKDYYSVLGVPKTATGKEIKQAFRKLAREQGVDLNIVPGSGNGGRVTKDDVMRAARVVPLDSSVPPPPVRSAPAATRASGGCASSDTSRPCR